jgi:hypothetical protein
MTQEETLEYNKRCAEFLGATPTKDWLGKDGYELKDNELWYHTQWSNRFQDTLELYSYRYSDLKFHSDWNWIMEVVEAIEKLESNDFYMEWFWLNGTNMALYQRHKQNGSNLWECSARFSDVKTKKEAVVRAINQFLIWYNANKI